MVEGALHLVILAGGSGSRAVHPADDTPKQYVDVGGRPLILWSLIALAAHPRVATVCVACSDERREDLETRIVGAGVGRPICFASAGDTRTASTWSALAQLDLVAGPGPNDLVAVHDAARPFATSELLERLAVAAGEHDGAVPGVPVADTIVAASEDGAEYLYRDALRAVQTPQVFRWAPFHTAHEQAHRVGSSFTDDGGLMAAAGRPPRVVPGDHANWKVTTFEDLQRAMSLLGGRS